jgi:MFS family permease
LKSPGSSFWLLCVISLLAFISYDLIRSPLLPLFAERLGAHPEAIGLIVGISTITGILFKLPAGTISDLLGRRRLLFIGLSVFAVAPYFYFGVTQTWQLTVLRAFHGLATAIFAPVAMAVALLIAKAVGVDDAYTVGYIALVVAFLPAAVTWAVELAKREV